MKEMIYTTNHRNRDILDEGSFYGYDYYILSLGSHPTAYVRIPENHKFYNIKNYDDIPIQCHGGLTFMEDYLKIFNNHEVSGRFIGWDYAHIGDYSAYVGDETEKKWTTQEIQDDVKSVCKQLKEAE